MQETTLLALQQKLLAGSAQSQGVSVISWVGVSQGVGVVLVHHHATNMLKTYAVEGTYG